MFKGQPKGLYALALANTGERFGYYTMLAIFTLFLQAKFGFSEAVTSNRGLPGGSIFHAVHRRYPRRQVRLRQDGCCRYHRYVRGLFLPGDSDRRRHSGQDSHVRLPAAHRGGNRPVQGQPAGDGRQPLRRPQVLVEERRGLLAVLHGHKHRLALRSHGGYQDH